MKAQALGSILIGALLAQSPILTAQSDDDDDQQALESVVLTGTRLTAGGAQDINFARSEVISGRIPHPDSITAEGLLSQHDLFLPGSEACAKLFCVFGELIDPNLVSQANYRHLVGLGFASNIDPRRWRRQPANIVAVVDKSGSMDGEPLELVRQSLLSLVSTMQAQDQLSIVLYGERSHVYLQPSSTTARNMQSLRRAIKAIESAGSTNMEEGLRVGYQLAEASQLNFLGTTRVILFTDEQPNVGDTSADGFIAMAEAASQRRIGLTTIGVGVQFDAPLATQISSVRGGNLFYLPDRTTARQLFADELDDMISEVAHDLRFTISPGAELAIHAVYGIPGNILSWADNGVVTFTIPTVFMSRRGGGIFVALGPRHDQPQLPPPAVHAGDPVLHAAIRYRSADEQAQEESHLAEVLASNTKASHAMRLASILIDEYLTLKQATTHHYINHDHEAAYQSLRALSERLDEIGDRRLYGALQDEFALVDQLLEKFAFLSGHASETRVSKAAKIWGLWQVHSARAADDGDDSFDFKAGDFFIFTPDNQVVLFTQEDRADLDWDLSQQFIMHKKHLVLDHAVFKYRLRGQRLSLRSSLGKASLRQLQGFHPSMHEPRAAAARTTD